jgi:hypothetical protein
VIPSDHDIRVRLFRAWCLAEGLQCPVFAVKFMSHVLRKRGFELRRFSVRVNGRHAKLKHWGVDRTSAARLSRLLAVP